MRLQVGAAALFTGWFGFVACTDAFTGSDSPAEAGAAGDASGTAGSASEGGSSGTGEAGGGSIEPGEGGNAGTSVIGAAGEGGGGTVTPGPVSITSCKAELGGGTCRNVIGVGSWTTCAITPSGVVKCVGLNQHGQLGDGKSAHEPCGDDAKLDCTDEPVEVKGLEGAAQLAGGEQTNCALNTLGHLYCWGMDLRMAGDLTIATRFGTSEGSVAVSLRLPFGVLPGDGTAWVGGLDEQANGVYGSGAFPTANERRFLSPVTGLEDVVAFDLGFYHGCAARKGGGVVCWGKDVNAELGDGAKMNRNSPVAVKNVSSAVGVAVGDGSSCALLESGGVTCWGTGHPGVAATPTPVEGLIGVLDIRGGFGHFCALLDTGKVSCWGRNELGQSGLQDLGTSVTKPTLVKGVSGAVAIGLGAHHSCALLEGGKLLCWGENGVGQLGRGNYEASSGPGEVKGL